jgi:paraquat-inducible protein B
VEQGDFRVPVTIKVPAVQGTAYGGGQILLTGTMEQRLQTLVDKGLRASLATQSIITGKLGVVLDFRPDTPVNLVGGELPHPEIPTVRSGLSQVMQDLSEIPFKEILLDVQKTIRGIDGRVQSEEVTRAINSISETLDEFKQLGGQLNEKIGPLVENVESTSTEARETLREAGEAIQGVSRDIQREAENLDKTLADVRKLVDSVDAEVKPTAEDLRATLKDLRGTLKSVNGAAAQVELLLRSDSPAVTDLRRALVSLADAARGIKALAETLEKQPESLIRGKRGG